MIRYTTQRGRGMCGPAAIANVVKWLGYSFSYRDNKKSLSSFTMNHYLNILHTGHNIGIKVETNGTLPYKISDWLKKLSSHTNLTFKFSYKARIREIERFMSKKDRAVLLACSFKSKGIVRAHYFLIVGMDSNHFDVVNLYVNKPAKIRISREFLMKRYLTLRKPWRRSWFLSK